MFYIYTYGEKLTTTLVFLFLEETGYDRAGDNHPELLSRRKGSLLRKRLALFFPGTAVVPGASLAQVVRTIVFSYLGLALRL